MKKIIFLACVFVFVLQGCFWGMDDSINKTSLTINWTFDLRHDCPKDEFGMTDTVPVFIEVIGEEGNDLTGNQVATFQRTKKSSCNWLSESISLSKGVYQIRVRSVQKEKKICSAWKTVAVSTSGYRISDNELHFEFDTDCKE